VILTIEASQYGVKRSKKQAIEMDLTHAERKAAINRDQTMG
jgi:hypothetical protein